MLIYEFKLKAQPYQYQAIDEAIRTGQFIRNKCLRYWMEAAREEKVDRYALNKHTKVLAEHPEYPFVAKLNSMARQASAERAWASISRFYDNGKQKIPGKKGFPQFKKFSRSVEYKTTGWSLSEDRKYLTITDKTDIGRLKLVGSRDLHFYQKDQIKRIRLVKRADGYYAQFCIDVNRTEDTRPTGQLIGLDVGLESFYTDSKGEKVENPRFLRKAERKLKKLQRRLAKCTKGSNNSKKAQAKLARQHLKVSRRRKDFVAPQSAFARQIGDGRLPSAAVKTARAVAMSNDIVAIENLSVKGLARTRMAKSINDAGWTLFKQWLEYFCNLFDRRLVAVSPHYTSQDCSSCGKRVKKSLSTRTHVCSCGARLCRDENAAINILNKGLDRVGHTRITQEYWVNASGQMSLLCMNESLYTKLAG